MTKKTIRKQSQFRLKPACAALLLAFAVQTTQANPIGAAVVNGQASFATVGNTLTVTNTPGAIINWQGFSIGANEITRFAQQSASSAVLNRVISNNPSSILGSLQSNGRVFLVNPNGIVFGQGSTINVAGLVATSLNLSNADFIAGRYNFTDVPGAQNISNAGNLTAQTGGQIYLIAPNVENTGIITAPNGEILLAAGHSVDLVDTANPNIRVNITAPAGDATNVGQLVAEAGSLGLFGTVVRNSGTVSADSATLQGGKIVFKASQRTEISGIVTADGTTGGTIQALGNQVGIMDGATVTSNGAQGGGTILIGGDYQGKNSDVPNAQVTYVAPTASISADATNAGDGGKVIVWADDTTRAYGNISVRGGTNGGDGGFVETSGHNYLDFQGRVDTRAPQGSDGTLLLDPSTINIDNSTDNLAGGTSPSTGVFSGATGTATLTWSTINTQLLLGSLTIQTSAGTGGTGDININAGTTLTGTNYLLLLANNDINFGTLSPVSVSGSGDFNLIAGWNNSGWAVDPGIGKITFGPSSTLTGGNIWFNAGNAIIQDPSATIIANTLGIGGYGGVSLPGTNMVTTLAANISSGGSLNFSNGKALTIGIATYSNGINAWGNPNPINITTTVGDLTITQPILSNGLFGGSPITLTAAGTLNLNAAVTSTNNGIGAGPVVLQAGIGSVTSNASGIITAGGLKVVSGGSVTLNANNAINNLAGSSVSNFQFSNSKGFTVSTVGAVAPVIGLTASTGDITLKAGGLDSLLTISQNVQATTGSVFYVADNLAHNAFTTTSGSAGNFVELKPFTAATNIEFSAAADAPGLLRLSSGELNNFFTPLLRVGNSTVAGNIAITEPVAPGAFSSLSLITGGAITQDIGCTITIANLNADGWLGVTLNEANDIINLGGHTNTGNFAFTDVNAINVALVDVNNGITVDTSGGITLNAGSSVSQSAATLLTAPTSLTVIAANGIILNGALSTTGGNVLLNANTAGVGGAIVMNTGSSITSNGGNITLGGGTAGNGTGNAIGTATYVEGVSLNGATLNAGGGNIALNGTGFAGTAFADGIYVTGTSLIQTNAAGSIALNGTGGAGTDDNNGVRIGTTSFITSVDGTISLIGYGGAATGSRNRGVYVHNGATISATGAGIIMLNGTGSSTGTASNDGVRIASGAAITSNSGGIDITGLGSSGSDGVQVVGASTVLSNLGGMISLTSTGGAVTQTGNLITTGGAILVTADTNLTMGSAAKAQSAGNGISYIATNGSVQLGLLDAGAGSVYVEAGENITDGNGASNNIKAGSASLVASNVDPGPGSIDVDTQVADLYVDNHKVYWTAGQPNNPITVRNSGSALKVSVYSNWNPSPSLLGTEQLTITNNNTINVGHIGGALNTTLTAIGASSDITVEQGLATLLSVGDIVLNAGQDILITHDYVEAGGSVTATAGRDIRIASVDPQSQFLAAPTYIQAANGIDLTMQTGGLYIDGAAPYPAYLATTSGNINVVTSTGFTNNGGAGALSAPNGRWLVYAPNPGSVTKNGLIPAFYQYNTAYPGTVASTGSGFVYASPLFVDAAFSGTLSSTFGTSPTATPGYVLRGLDSGDTTTAAAITGSATYSNWPITSLTAADSYVLQYVSGLSVSSFYSLTPGTSQTYTVNPATLNFIITASLTGTAGKTYDGTNTATLAPGNFLLSGFVPGDSATVTKTTGTYASPNVGSGILVSTTLAPSDFSPVGPTNLSNYTLPTSASGPIGSITTAPLTVTANARSKVYGNADPALTYVASGFLLLTDTLTGGLTRTTGENVGAYAITQGTLANPNYTISYTGNNLSITRAALTVAANNASKIYDAIPYSGGNGVTYSGLTHGDTAAALGGTLTYSGTSQGAVNAGSYVITPGGLTSGNYTISFVDGILTITPAGLTLLSVAANNASKTYGTTLTFAGTEFTPVGLLGGDTIGGVTLTSPGAVNTANAGTYAITPSNAVFSVGNASNYTLSYVNGQLTVNPAALTLSANAQSKVYGNADPALTYVASGLLFTDTLTGGLTRTTGENVGAYAITQGTLSNPNYTISYTGNNLGITPAALTVAANALSKTAGNIDPLLTYMVTGLKLADTEATTLSGALARLAGETAGIYPINQGTLTLLSTNYTMNYIPADFSILAQAVTPTLLNNLMNDIVVLPYAPTDDATTDADAKKKDAEADAQDADALAAELAPAAAQMPVCK